MMKARCLSSQQSSFFSLSEDRWRKPAFLDTKNYHYASTWSLIVSWLSVRASPQIFTRAAAPEDEERKNRRGKERRECCAEWLDCRSLCHFSMWDTAGWITSRYPRETKDPRVGSALIRLVVGIWINRQRLARVYISRKKAIGRRSIGESREAISGSAMMRDARENRHRREKFAKIEKRTFRGLCESPSRPFGAERSSAPSEVSDQRVQLPLNPIYNGIIKLLDYPVKNSRAALYHG